MYKIRPFKNLLAVNHNFLKNKRRKFGTKIIKLYVIQCPELEKNKKSIIKYEKRVGEVVKKNEIVAEISTASWKPTPVRATVGGVIDRICASDGEEISYNQDLFCIRPLKEEIASIDEDIDKAAIGENQKNTAQAASQVNSTQGNKNDNIKTNNLLENKGDAKGKHKIENKTKLGTESSEPKKLSKRSSSAGQEKKKEAEYPKGNTMKFITELLCEEPKSIKKSQHRPKNNVLLPKNAMQGNGKHENINPKLLNDIPEEELHEMPISYDQVHQTKSNPYVKSFSNERSKSYDRPKSVNPKTIPNLTYEEGMKKGENQFGDLKDNRKNSSSPNLNNNSETQKIGAGQGSNKCSNVNFITAKSRVQVRQQEGIELPKAAPTKEYSDDYFYNAKEIDAPYVKTKKSLHTCDVPVYEEEIKVEKVKPQQKVVQVYHNQNKKRMFCDEYEEVKEDEDKDIQKYPELSLPKLPKFTDEKMAAKKRDKSKSTKKEAVQKSPSVEPLHDINFFEDKNPFKILSKVSGSQAARITISKFEEQERKKVLERTASIANIPKSGNMKMKGKPSNVLAVSYRPLEVKTRVNKTNISPEEETDNISPEDNNLPDLSSKIDIPTKPIKPVTAPPKRLAKLPSDQPNISIDSIETELKNIRSQSKNMRNKSNLHKNVLADVKRNIPKMKNNRYELEAAEKIARNNLIKRISKPVDISTDDFDNEQPKSAQKKHQDLKPLDNHDFIQGNITKANRTMMSKKGKNRSMWDLPKFDDHRTKSKVMSQGIKKRNSGRVRIGQKNKNTEFKIKSQTICTTPQIENTINGVRIVDRFSQLSPTIDARSDFELASFSPNTFTAPKGPSYVSLTELESSNAKNKLKMQVTKNDVQKKKSINLRSEFKVKMHESENAKLKIREKNSKIKKIN